MKELGKKIELEKDVFKAQEGSVNLYYGQIRSGKTYGATADILDDLRRGELVYATWPIKVDDFDDRQSLFFILLNLFLFRSRFFRVNCSRNFHYINAETGELDGVKMWNPDKPQEYIEFLNKLNHCKLYIDEAWRVIDSYQGTNFGIAGRNLILVTGHKFRTVNLIAQRPTSIHVTARGNVNRFYKFEKRKLFGLIIFRRSEYQDMVGETVNDNEHVVPLSVKRYLGRRKVYQAYNSYYYGELKPLHDVDFEVYELGFWDRLRAFGRRLIGRRANARRLAVLSDNSIRKVSLKGLDN